MTLAFWPSRQTWLAGCALLVLAAPLQAQEAPPLSAYGELPVIEDVELSREGRLAMLATNGGKRLILALDSQMTPLSATEVGDIKIRDIGWIGEEAIHVLRSETVNLDRFRFLSGKTEMWASMFLPADGRGEVHTVFQGDRTMVDAVFGVEGFRQVNGQWTGYFAGIEMKMGSEGRYTFQGEAPALFAVQVGSKNKRRVTTTPNDDETLDWFVDPSGAVVSTLSFNDLTGAWRLLDARGRTLTSGSSQKGSGRVVSYSADGAGLVYWIKAEHEPSKTFQIPLTGGEPQVLFDGADVDQIFTDPVSGRMIGYLPLSSEEGEGAEQQDNPIFFDPLAQQRVGTVISQFSEIGGTVRGWMPDYSRVLVHTSGNGDAGTWYLVDTVTEQAHVIGRARPQISPYQVGPISLVTYTAQDGMEIEGVLTLPPGREAKNLPVIILPHGGPRSHDSTNFDWWAQAFASRGYAVLQPNFRGSTGYGEEFLHAGDGEWGRKMQTDLSDGLAHLAEQGIVDPARACIMGASYGGYAALAGVTLQQGLYRCAVSVAGVSDLEVFFNREYRETGKSRETREGWLEQMGPRDTLPTISPRRFAAKVEAPVLLIHGRDDTVVPYEQSTLMASALRNASKPVELVELAGEDHWLSRAATRQQMLTAAMAFVQEHNPAD